MENEKENEKIKKMNDEKSEDIKRIEEKYDIIFEEEAFHENVDGKDVILRFGTISQKGLLDIMVDVYGEVI